MGNQGEIPWEILNCSLMCNQRAIQWENVDLSHVKEIEERFHGKIWIDIIRNRGKSHEKSRKDLMGNFGSHS